MSFASRNPSLKNDVLVVGDAWRGPAVARAFLDCGAKTSLYVLPFPTGPTPPECTVHVGNGEFHDKARLIMGNAMADTIWEISARNFALAKAYATESGMLEWHPQSVTEPALALDWRRFAGLVPSTEVDDLVSVEKQSMEYTARFKKKEKIVETKAHVVIFVGELPASEYFSWLHDKWIPVTLSSFLFSTSISSERTFLGSVFNGGVDFAFHEKSGLRLGSYRNLYADKAVGVHATADPVTLAGVQKFFGDKKWISDEKPLQTYLSVEALSCEGLPIVGPIPELPGVYLIGAFAGRVQNFLFEAARGLAASLVHGAPLGDLALFSTKRFV